MKFGIRVAPIVAFCSLGLTLLVIGQEQGPWLVPADARARKNPIAAGAGSVEKGKELFATVCAMCHGPRGDGESAFKERSPAPLPNFTDAQWQKQRTDGELFWKISEGRGVMLRFAEKYSETERWHLVNYIRSFARNRKWGK